LAALDKPTFFVLEGGYIGGNVGKAVDVLLKTSNQNSQFC